MGISHFFEEMKNVTTFPDLSELLHLALRKRVTVDLSSRMTRAGVRTCDLLASRSMESLNICFMLTI